LKSALLVLNAQGDDISKEQSEKVLKRLARLFPSEAVHFEKT
jgi:hypothetical protein